MADGSSTPRMIAASISTAAARPTPICFICSSSDESANIENTATITIAALVDHAGGALDPVRDRVLGVHPAIEGLRIRLTMNTW